jgi:glutathione S-transferase
MDFCAIHVFHAMSRVLFNRTMAPLMGKEADKNSELAGVEFLEKYSPILDKQLGSNQYLAGDQITLADMNLLAILDPFELMQFSLEPYKNVTKWRSSLMAQEFYRKCYSNYSEFVRSAMARMK